MVFCTLAFIFKKIQSIRENIGPDVLGMKVCDDFDRFETQKMNPVLIRCGSNLKKSNFMIPSKAKQYNLTPFLFYFVIVLAVTISLTLILI